MLNSIDWENPQTSLRLNPRLSPALKERFQRAVSGYDGQAWIWLQSSGTELSKHGEKLVALSYPAFLHAARSVVNYYNIGDKDLWLNPLPKFHVGGLSIGARCFVSGAQEITYQGPWSAQMFVNKANDVKATWTSLVPTQIHDLVSLGLKAPVSLEGVLVGGGALSLDLAQKAVALGWPLIPSYGMTETCALLAGREKPLKRDCLESSLKLLPHVKLYPNGPDRYRIESPALFAGYLFIEPTGNEQWQPRPKPFVLDDRLIVHEDSIEILGRQSELVKILGESVNIAQLTQRLEKTLAGSVALVPIPEPRRGHQLHLFIEVQSDPLPMSLESLNSQLMPFERITELHKMAQLPRSPLGKIRYSELLQRLKELSRD